MYTREAIAKTLLSIKKRENFAPLGSFYYRGSLLILETVSIWEKYSGLIEKCTDMNDHMK